MSAEIKLPPLPASQMNVEVWDSEVRGLHGADAPYYTADQMEAYARHAVLEERGRLPEVQKALNDLAGGVNTQENYQTVRVFIEGALGRG